MLLYSVFRTAKSIRIQPINQILIKNMVKTKKYGLVLNPDVAYCFVIFSEIHMHGTAYVPTYWAGGAGMVQECSDGLLVEHHGSEPSKRREGANRTPGGHPRGIGGQYNYSI